MATTHTTLHQRRPNLYTTVPTSSTSTSASAAPMSATSSILRSTEITSSTLLKSNPIHHSKIYKLKIPFIYTILPTPLLTILQFCIYPLLLLCNIKLKPYWVQRYFILIGNYIYKFQPNSIGSMGKNDMKMKGCPIPLQSITVSSLQRTAYGIITPNPNINQNTYIHDSSDMMDVTIPIQMNCNGYLTINSNSKTSYYATTTQLDAQTWINVLRDARQECITYNMGHSKRPIGKEVEYVNMMGKRIVDQKQRISDLIRRRELEEVEMICLDGGGVGSGGLPRGYFG